MMIRTLRPLLLLALLLLCSRVNGADERWYVMLMDEHRAGWMVERERVEDGRVISESETRMTLRRDETELTLSIETRFVETERGEPIEMWAKTVYGGTPSEELTVFGDEITWTQTQNGVSQTKTMPTPEGRWLAPASASRYVAERLKAGAERIVVRVVEPVTGVEPVTTTRSGFEQTTIEVMGRSVDALRCTTVSSVYPDVESVEYVDGKGRLLRSEVSIGTWEMTILAADEQLAMSPLDPPELMRSVFVKPDREIERPYRASRSSFIVSASEGVLPDLPASGSQWVERLDGARVRVRRDLAEPPPVAETLEPGEMTGSTAMLTCDDPRVTELARDALTAAPEDTAKRAELLRRFVHRHIRTKDLSVGFASAAEVARTREGDCTEHGVLLAALLRADGIPSRVVSGLIYADRFAGSDDIFGYHMWTQAYLEINGKPRWVDLDATLPDTLPLTATHIALAVTGLPDENRINALVELAPLMGRLAIKVESVE